MLGELRQRLRSRDRHCATLRAARARVAASARSCHSGLAWNEARSRSSGTRRDRGASRLVDRERVSLIGIKRSHEPRRVGRVVIFPPAEHLCRNVGDRNAGGVGSLSLCRRRQLQRLDDALSNVARVHGFPACLRPDSLAFGPRTSHADDHAVQPAWTWGGTRSGASETAHLLANAASRRPASMPRVSGRRASSAGHWSR